MVEHGLVTPEVMGSILGRAIVVIVHMSSVSNISPPLTSSNNYFTKIAEFVVVEDHTSAASAAAAYAHWISRYPCPRKWTTNCGT